MMVRSLLIVLCLISTGLFAGDDEEARERARRKLLADLQDARVLFNDKQYEEAEKAFADFLDHYGREENTKHLDPPELDAVLLEAQIARMDAMARLKKVEALEAFGTSKMTAKASVRNHLLRAKTKLWKRDREGYEVELKAAVALDEEAYLGWFLLGELYMGMRKEEMAIEHLKKSLEHHEDFAEAHYLLGQIYLRRGDKQNTRKHWNAFLESEPRKGSRFTYVNNTLLKMGGG